MYVSVCLCVQVYVCVCMYALSLYGQDFVLYKYFSYYCDKMLSGTLPVTYDVLGTEKGLNFL